MKNNKNKLQAEYVRDNNSYSHNCYAVSPKNMKINYNTNGTYWIQDATTTCPFCSALNPSPYGSYICHNCKRIIDVNQTYYISPNIITDRSPLPHFFDRDKKITEISQILEVLERNGLLEKGVYFDEGKYNGKFCEVHSRLIGWSIVLSTELLGTKITLKNDSIRTIGDLEFIIAKFKNI